MNANKHFNAILIETDIEKLYFQDGFKNYTYNSIE